MKNPRTALALPLAALFTLLSIAPATAQAGPTSYATSAAGSFASSQASSQSMHYSGWPEIVPLYVVPEQRRVETSVTATLAKRHRRPLVQEWNRGTRHTLARVRVRR